MPGFSSASSVFRSNYCLLIFVLSIMIALIGSSSVSHPIIWCSFCTNLEVKCIWLLITQAKCFSIWPISIYSSTNPSSNQLTSWAIWLIQYTYLLLSLALHSALQYFHNFDSIFSFHIIILKSKSLAIE